MRARGLVDFSKIPERDRQFYMDRGTANHRLWEDVEKGIDDQFNYDARVEVYRKAHARFLAETGFKAFAKGIEMRVHSDKLKVAGTLDRFGIGMMSGRYTLLDYKTTSLPPSAKSGLPTPTEIQTAIYLLCLENLVSWSTVDRYGVAFRKDGTYRMSEKYPSKNREESLWHVSEYWKSQEE